MPSQPQGQTTDEPAAAFGAWTLDRRTGVLARRGGPVVTLRPKTASVLGRLLAEAGILVSREALLDDVWPGVNVTDDSVTQCIAEIRRALGEDGRLLRTAPRRGYVLDVPVPSAAPPSPGHAPAAEPPGIQPPGPIRPARPGRRLAALAGAASLAACCLAAAVMVHLPGGGRAESQRLLGEGRTVFYGAGERRLVWPEARRLFQRAHDADPSNPEADAWAAFTFTNMIIAGYATSPADLAEAARLADRAVALGPGMGLTWAARAGVYRLQRRYAEALATYRRAFELDPRQLPAEANTGWMLVLLGQPREAIAPISGVLAATRPDHPFRATWLCYLGVAQFAAGEADRGVAALRTGLGASESCLPPAERDFTLVAALALDGEVTEAGALLGTIRRQWPAVTGAALRAHALSDDAGYLAQREALFRGLTLAGFTDAPPAR